MSSMMSSQGLVLATAMVVSSTVLFLTFSRQKSLFLNQHQEKRNTPPRSCLYTDEKKRRKKKRVQFAESVKEPRGNGKEFRDQQKKKTSVSERNCRRIPENRTALYGGIIRDRVMQRIECSF